MPLDLSGAREWLSQSGNDEMSLRLFPIDPEWSIFMEVIRDDQEEFELAEFRLVEEFHDLDAEF